VQAKTMSLLGAGIEVVEPPAGCIGQPISRRHTGISEKVRCVALGNGVLAVTLSRCDTATPIVRSIRDIVALFPDAAWIGIVY
jgi:hypothetical protein